MKFYFLTEIRISFYFVQKGENERKKDNKREKEPNWYRNRNMLGITMYPKLFAASGIAYPALLDNLISLAMEDEPWYRQQ